jgi:hypothetical protein
MSVSQSDKMMSDPKQEVARSKKKKRTRVGAMAIQTVQIVALASFLFFTAGTWWASMPRVILEQPKPTVRGYPDFFANDVQYFWNMTSAPVNNSFLSYTFGPVTGGPWALDTGEAFLICTAAICTNVTWALIGPWIKYALWLTCDGNTNLATSNYITPLNDGYNFLMTNMVSWIVNTAQVNNSASTQSIGNGIAMGTFISVVLDPIYLGKRYCNFTLLLNAPAPGARFLFNWEFALRQSTVFYGR